jgi:hypothetical protein
MSEVSDPVKPGSADANQEPEIKQDSGMKSAYGFYIAIFGLTISFFIAVIMIISGMKTAGDLVAVIAAFTGITGTLAGYFFGEKAGSAGKENTEKKLAETVDSLISEKTENADVAGNLLMSENKNKILSTYLQNNQTAIDKTIGLLRSNAADAGKRGLFAEMHVGEMSQENLVNEALLSLNEAKIPQEIRDALHTYDD